MLDYLNIQLAWFSIVEENKNTSILALMFSPKVLVSFTFASIALAAGINVAKNNGFLNEDKDNQSVVECNAVSSFTKMRSSRGQRIGARGTPKTLFVLEDGRTLSNHFTLFSSKTYDIEREINAAMTTRPQGVDYYCLIEEGTALDPEPNIIAVSPDKSALDQILKPKK